MEQVVEVGLEPLVHEAVDDGVDGRVGHGEPVAEEEEHGHVGPVAEEGQAWPIVDVGE